MAPGQNEWIAGLFVAAGDTLHVIDNGLRRWTVRSRSGQVARVVPFPGAYRFDMVSLGGNRMLINAFLGSPAHAGHPLHIFGTDGKHLHSFGADDHEVVRSDLGSTTMRKLAVDARDGIWAARINEYRLEYWDRDFRKVRSLVRSPVPFERWIASPRISPSIAPVAEIRGVHVDARGRLWVMYWAIDTGWRENLEELETPEGSAFRPRRMSRVYDTVIEVIDPIRGEVLATSRIDACLMEFIAEGMAYGFDEDAPGAPQIGIWQLSFP